MWLHVHVTGNPVFLFYVYPGFFLWNVGGIFPVLVWHLQQLVVTKKFSGPKYNLPKSDQMFFRQHYTGFFSCAMLSWSLLGNIAEFLPVQCCPQSTKTTLIRSFHVRCYWELFRQHCTRFLPVQCCPRAHKHLFAGKSPI